MRPAAGAATAWQPRKTAAAALVDASAPLETIDTKRAIF
jgi:hypothetical protein